MRRSWLLWALLVLLDTRHGLPQRLTPAQEPIPPTYFGMHIHHLISGNEPNPSTPWPQVRVPAWRLWDVRATWSDLEPAKGQWEFDGLDRILQMAEEHDTQVQLTFGFTPAWASKRPNEGSLYRPGGAAEPRSLDDWTNFVHAVAARYRGRIHIYEIWNEPNVPRYWSGSAEQMVELTHLAHDAIKGIDASATIVAPSPVGEAGLVWLSSFLSAGGGRYVDVIGFHFYVSPAPPEAMVALINSVKAILRGYEANEKPLWDTEAGWSKPSPFPSDEMAAAYLARAFLLNWADGVQRFYWYAWDNHGWVSLRTTEIDNRTLTPAGVAYGVLQKWLTGTVMNWCAQDANHTWACQLTDHAKNEWVAWNPDRSTCLTIPPSWEVGKVVPLLSRAQPVHGTCVEIGPTPELLTR